jgi:hypothetical protein
MIPKINGGVKWMVNASAERQPFSTDPNLYAKSRGFTTSN